VFLPLVLMKQKIAAFHFSLPPVAISCTIHFLSFLYLDDSLHQRYHQRCHQLNDPKPKKFSG
jgi:hypothetical protein